MSSTQKYTSMCSALQAKYFYSLWHESGLYYPRGQALCRTLLPSCGQEYTTCPRLLPVLEGPLDCIRRNPADHKKTPLMIFQLSVGNSLRRSPHDNTSEKPNWEHLKSHDRLSNDISATSAVHCGYSYKHPYVDSCRTRIQQIDSETSN